MTQPPSESPGIGGVPGLPQHSGPAFRSWRRLMQTIGVYAPRHLHRAARARKQIAALSRGRK